MTVDHGSLFSGCGALDLAVNAVFGSRTRWLADNDPHASAVLAQRFPGVPNLGDVVPLDWATVLPVHIISGGSPCQDLSTAGKRAGLSEGTRSNQWIQMREAIAHVRPQYVVWENVRGALIAGADSDLGWTVGRLDGRTPDQAAKEEGRALRALGRVLGDLADLGYDAQWCGLPASGVGAPHPRFRVFLLATDRHRVRTQVPDQGQQPTVQVTGRDGPPGRTDGRRVSPLIRRWERVTGHLAPDPTDHTGQLSAEFTEWLMGLPPGWITDVPDITRTERNRIAGNSVVPHQAEAALRHLLAVSRLTA